MYSDTNCNDQNEIVDMYTCAVSAPVPVKSKKSFTYKYKLKDVLDKIKIFKKHNKNPLKQKPSLQIPTTYDECCSECRCRIFDCDDYYSKYDCERYCECDLDW